MLKRNERDKWPESLVELFGSWGDDPALNELRSGYGADAAREELDRSDG